MIYIYSFLFIQVFAQSSVENLKKPSQNEIDNIAYMKKRLYQCRKAKTLSSVSQAYIVKGDRKNFFSYSEKEQIERPFF